MRRWFAGLLALALAAAGCSTDDEGPPVPWLALYDKPLNVIGVRALDGRCGASTTVDEDDNAIRVHMVEIHQPGAGACPAHYGLVPADLRAPVGNRDIVSADPGISGVAIDIAGLLHFPMKTKEDLPFGFDDDTTSDDARFVLFYSATATHPALKLTSTLAPRGLRDGSVIVRAGRNAEPCDSIICWEEGINLYRIDPIRGDTEPMSQAIAIAAAAQLTRG